MQQTLSVLRHRGQSDISDWLIRTGDLEERLQRVGDRDWEKGNAERDWHEHMSRGHIFIV